jgi:pimeloyl-ACP methyl ester carboxylesterase
VALLAAARDPEAVDFIVTISGPGVTPEEQERGRIARDLERHGIDGTARDDALAWVDERARRLLAGEPPESILADQERLADNDWYEIVVFGAYDDSGVLGFGARIMGFDPLPSARALRCPALVLFGGADQGVPVARSVELLAGALPGLAAGHSGIAVFPGASHGLFIADPDPDIPRRDQLAPGFLPMLAAFLHDAAGVGRARSG